MSNKDLTCILEGWLLKRKVNNDGSNKTGFFSANKRYFRIQEAKGLDHTELALCYYKSPKEREPRGWIYLKDVTEIFDDEKAISVLSMARSMNIEASAMTDHLKWLQNLIDYCPQARTLNVRSRQAVRKHSNNQDSYNKAYNSLVEDELPSLSSIPNDLLDRSASLFSRHAEDNSFYNSPSFYNYSAANSKANNINKNRKLRNSESDDNDNDYILHTESVTQINRLESLDKQLVARTKSGGGSGKIKHPIIKNSPSIQEDDEYNNNDDDKNEDYQMNVKSNKKFSPFSRSVAYEEELNYNLNEHSIVPDVMPTTDDPDNVIDDGDGFDDNELDDHDNDSDPRNSFNSKNKSKHGIRQVKSNQREDHRLAGYRGSTSRSGTTNRLHQFISKDPNVISSSSSAQRNNVNNSDAKLSNRMQQQKYQLSTSNNSIQTVGTVSEIDSEADAHRDDIANNTNKSNAKHLKESKITKKQTKNIEELIKTPGSIDEIDALMDNTQIVRKRYVRENLPRKHIEYQQEYEDDSGDPRTPPPNGKNQLMNSFSASSWSMKHDDGTEYVIEQHSSSDGSAIDLDEQEHDDYGGDKSVYNSDDSRRNSRSQLNQNKPAYIDEHLNESMDSYLGQSADEIDAVIRANPNTIRIQNSNNFNISNINNPPIDSKIIINATVSSNEPVKRKIQPPTSAPPIQLSHAKNVSQQLSSIILPNKSNQILNRNNNKNNMTSIDSQSEDEDENNSDHDFKIEKKVKSISKKPNQLNIQSDLMLTAKPPRHPPGTKAPYAITSHTNSTSHTSNTGTYREGGSHTPPRRAADPGIKTDHDFVHDDWDDDDNNEDNDCNNNYDNNIHHKR
eukprot:gene8010-10855_t